MKKSNLLISILIVLLFIYVLFKFDVFTQLKTLIYTVNYTYIVFALFIYVFVYVFRALRLKLYVEEVSFLEMLSVIGVHTFFNNILPFRSGEASFPIILKKLFGIEASKSSVVLFGARIFDIIALSVLFFISLFFVSFSDRRLMFLPVLALIVIGVLLFILYKVLHFFKERVPFFGKLLLLSSMFAGFDTLFFMFLFSIIIWILKFTAFMLILNAAHLDLSFFKTVFVSTFAELTTVLPIHSFGGFGTFEAGMVGGFSLIGISPKSALPYAVYFHTLILLMSGITAIFGWFYLSFRKNRG